MINIIFGILIIVGIIYSLLTGNISTMGNTILKSSKITLDMILQIFPLIALWLGIMKIASSSGLLKKLSNLLKPILKIIFPDIPSNHESFEYISSNMIATLFGLGNAATPFGIKAMKSLKKINNSDCASDSMITLLILNTTGFTLIPTTVLALRMNNNSLNPNSIIPLSILSSFLSLLFGLIINYLFRKINK